MTSQTLGRDARIPRGLSQALSPVHGEDRGFERGICFGFGLWCARLYRRGRLIPFGMTASLSPAKATGSAARNAAGVFCLVVTLAGQEPLRSSCSNGATGAERNPVLVCDYVQFKNVHYWTLSDGIWPLAFKALIVS